MALFSDRFKMLREQRGWTQDDAAERLGISRSTIAGYESGAKARVPREDMLIKIADVFDVSIDYLLGRTDEPKAIATNDDNDPSISPEEREFLRWVEENLESSFFYDFDRSPEESKREMMETLRFIWEREKRRRPGQKQGE
jgi:transcriptional regulator with XRE-family HTH domain